MCCFSYHQNMYYECCSNIELNTCANKASRSNPSFVQKAIFKIYNLHPTTHHTIYILTVIQLEKLKYYGWRELHSVLPQYLSKFISKISPFQYLTYIYFALLRMQCKIMRKQ